MKLEELQGRTLAGRFRLDRLLGKGGYGAVFEAEQLSVGRRCAVKVLFAHLCDDEATAGRFRGEARTTSRLTHPNTIILYDFGRDEREGLLFLAMELLDGRDLTTVIRQNGLLSVEQAVHVTVQMAASLQEAHNMGLVHRDIKPRNVMLLERGNDPMFVKVIDFGIAKVVNSKWLTASDLTQTGTIIGTPKYMSPEQIRDSQIDGRTDMYALALSVYKMLTGRTPFEEGTALEIAGRQIAETPKPVSAFHPGLEVSDQFEQVLLKALAKDPVDRFECVADFARALVEASSGANAHMLNSGMTPTSLPRPTQPNLTQPSPNQSSPNQSSGTRPGPTNTLPDDTPSAVQRRRAQATQDLTGPVGEDSGYQEVTYMPDAGLAPVGGRHGAPAGESGQAVTADIRPEDDATANEIAGKTLATMAIPNAARPEAGDGTQRAGNTAEVESNAVSTASVGPDGDTVSPSLSQRMPDVSVAHLAAVVAALLIVLGGIAWYSTGDDGGDPVQLAAAKDGEDDPPALTAGVPGTEDKASAQPSAERADEVLEAPARAADDADQANAEPDVPADTEKADIDEEAEEVPGDPAANADESDNADRDPPPQKPVKRRHRYVEVRVIPWGTLYIDGRKVGEGTRHTMRLREGRHRMVLKQDGEVRAKRTVDVTRRSSKIIEIVAR